MLHPPTKRLKHSSTDSSSRRTQDKIARPAIANAQASLPSKPGSRGKAERWFEDTNEHPREVSFVDDDPPYYMKNQLPEHHSVCATQSENSSHNVSKIGPTAPTRSLLAQMNADHDDGEDYRSVIDDLTVQNKKLKKKLKKYETLHCSHLQEEKLFEVRIHGLAADRKHELEETLRNFASSIDEHSPNRPLPADGGLPTRPKTATLLHKPSSSTTSASKPNLDSAYASMSGQTGVASQSHHVEHNVQERGFRANRQSVNSYLHDIPEALAPKPSVAMSDRSKSKSIARRLEQLFTGKAAASRQDGQSHQQQEVSQSAASSGGQRPGQEGTREAHILSADAELQVESMEDVQARANKDGSNVQSFHASRVGSPRSPEQRPTRPLDLDPHRAQNPADNMEYIRHLGLTSSAEDSLNGPASKDGWVYLNLLTGMAQLHTLNVTPEFIRRAVGDYSSKLELSPDQTKVRWLGGSTGTRMSSDDDESEDQMHQKPVASSIVLSGREGVQDGLPTRAGLAGASPTAPEVGAKRRPINTSEDENEIGDIHYRPLFFHTAESDEDVSDIESDSTGTSEMRNFTAVTGINSGATALNNRVTRLRGPSKKDGPMIFYNRAKFCTDLSGDLDGAKRRHSTYQLISQQPIGISDPQPDGSDEYDMEDQPIDVGRPSTSRDVNLDSTGSALDLDDLKSVISGFADGESSPLDPMDMEASGLGGIQPEDNFVVKVQVRHGKNTRAHRKPSSKARGPIRRILHSIPRSSLDAFGEITEVPQSTSTEQLMHGEIISSIKTDMAPSTLPPPSYVCLPLSSSGSSSSDDEESEPNEDASMSTTDNPPHPSIQNARTQLPTSLPPTTTRPQTQYTSLSTSSASSLSSDDSSSIDLLAHARGLDPETIAAREREFESNTGDFELAEVPAGSSAATVGGGGGSGRVSPRWVDGDGYGEENGEGGESDVNSMSVDGDGGC